MRDVRAELELALVMHTLHERPPLEKVYDRKRPAPLKQIIAI